MNLTPDPAGVSVPIKLLVGKGDRHQRLSACRDGRHRQRSSTSDKVKATELLAEVFCVRTPAPAGTHGAALINSLRDGGTGAGLLGSGAAAKRRVRTETIIV
ncbi:MAG: hypothetical protein M5U14_16605 [Acidimicrobiia bacterium]|nr:hypothetical protein [Acidimicrobiia bacterium]